MRTIQAIPVTLDKPRSLLIDLRAMAKAEQAIAKFWGEKRVSLIKIFQAGDLGVAELTHLLWAGLLHEDPTLTYDQALALFATVDLQALTTHVTAAVAAQMGIDEAAPPGEGQDPPQPGTLPNGTGSASGPPPGTTSA